MRVYSRNRRPGLREGVLKVKLAYPLPDGREAVGWFELPAVEFDELRKLGSVKERTTSSEFVRTEHSRREDRGSVAWASIRRVFKSWF